MSDISIAMVGVSTGAIFVSVTNGLPPSAIVPSDAAVTLFRILEAMSLLDGSFKALALVATAARN